MLERRIKDDYSLCNLKFITLLFYTKGLPNTFYKPLSSSKRFLFRTSIWDLNFSRKSR